MLDEKVGIIRNLNDSQTAILHYFFRGRGFTVKEVCEELSLAEKTVRGYITDIYEKFGVPDDVTNKREWVVSEYSEAYEFVFKREDWEAKQVRERLAGEPEIYISPPDPIVVPISDSSEGSQEPEIYIKPPEAVTVQTSEVSEATPAAPAQPSVQYVYVTETPGILILLVILFVISTMALGFRSLYLEDTRIPFGSEILYAEDFSPIINGQLSPDMIYSGSPILTNNGLLRTDDSTILVFGDNRWVNYTIYVRIYQYGCELSEGEEPRYSTIGVRYNASGFTPAYSWMSCESENAKYTNLRITVDGPWIEVKRIGFNEPILPIANIPADWDRGAAYLVLDKDSAIDDIVVVELPE